MISQEDKARFDSKYTPEPNSGCWLWDGSLDAQGYGKFRSDGRIKIASRVSWELHRYAISSSEWVLHKCDVSMCVNPDHLYLGDRTQNMYDAVRRGRMKNMGSVLSREQVSEIKHLLDQGMTRASIAGLYGVTTYTIRDIKAGRTWSN